MRILVFQHVAVEHPGIFRDFFAEDGIDWDAVELDAGEAIPKLEEYDALMVFGGPMDVWEEDQHPWLKAEKQAIRRWVRDIGRPYLGVCLGHQLLAAALGGHVGKMTEPEVGVRQIALTEIGDVDPLFSGVPAVFPALQWHGAAVLGLPEGAVVLAENAHCPVQSFRIGDTAYGIQFHIELGSTTVADWGCIPEYRTALEAITGENGLAELEAASAASLADFNRCARQLYVNFRTLMARQPVA
jgi:GMP synthase-like glutamine amidotransferase